MLIRNWSRRTIRGLRFSRVKKRILIISLSFRECRAFNHESVQPENIFRSLVEHTRMQKGLCKRPWAGGSALKDDRINTGWIRFSKRGASCFPKVDWTKPSRHGRKWRSLCPGMQPPTATWAVSIYHVLPSGRERFKKLRGLLFLCSGVTTGCFFLENP